MRASERLAREDAYLREIRVAIASLETTKRSAEKHRKGVAYASTALTTGPRLYHLVRELGFSSPAEFKTAEPEMFKKRVMEPNIRDGSRFAAKIAANGWRMVIEPGTFFAEGWGQEHYMSLWRQVIIQRARSIAFNDNVYWSTGGAEELLIGIQYEKRLLNASLQPLDPYEAVKRIESAIDAIDSMEFDAKPLYVIWRELTLTLEARRHA